MQGATAPSALWAVRQQVKFRRARPGPCLGLGGHPQRPRVLVALGLQANVPGFGVPALTTCCVHSMSGRFEDLFAVPWSDAVRALCWNRQGSFSLPNRHAKEASLRGWTPWTTGTSTTQVCESGFSWMIESTLWAGTLMFQLPNKYLLRFGTSNS